MAYCRECKMGFSKPSNLRAHVKRKHPDKLDKLAPITRNPSGSGNYSCRECDKCFTSFGNLRFHVKQKHSDKLDDLAPIEKKIYKCNLCDCQFDVLKQLIKHRSSHNIVKPINCSLCQYSGATADILVQHYKQDHCLQILNETLEFDSVEDFQVWKSNIEAEKSASFVQTSGVRKALQHTKTVYVCHRSGNIRTRGNNIRKPKICGSKKIGGYCPARITVFTKNNGKCTVQFCKSHVGHDQDKDLGHLLMTKSQRKHTTAKPAANISLQVILDEVGDSTENYCFEHIDLLTKRNIYNSEDSFHLKCSSLQHTNNAIRVDAWVNELKTSDSVPFYKSQESLCEEYPELKYEDFILIIMTQGQQDLLANFGEDCVCIDSTHELNGYGFELHTILVLDDLRESYPCAFLISNRSDIAVLKLFFTSVERRIGRKIRPRVFMSDMAETYYKAWVEIMLPAEFRFFCTWHVDRLWRKNLKKIVDKEKKGLIYQMLHKLLQERDVRSFQSLLQECLSYCRESSDTLEFANYFEHNYVNKSEQWAYCYRLNSGLSTNMHIERMHHTIKYIYLNGKFVKRLDKAIGAIMKFVRDKLYEKLIVLPKGKVYTKLSTIRLRHKNSESLDLNRVVQNDMAWLVSSASRNETYEVIEIKSDCSCMLTCDECKACIHRYSCTCIDSSIQWNMCKHIHLVCKFINQLQSSESQVQQVSSENLENLIININPKHIDISGLVRIKPVGDGQQQQVDERRKKLLHLVQEELLHATSLDEIEAAERIIASLKPTLAAARSQQQMTSSLAMTSSSSAPHNKKIESQRGLLTNKNLRKEGDPKKTFS